MNLKMRIRNYGFSADFLYRILIFSFPTFIFFFSSFFLKEISSYKLRISIIETAFLSIIIFNLIELVRNALLKKMLYVLGYIVVAIPVFVQISYYYLYFGRISESTIFIILETNNSEIYEFLKSYFTPFNIYVLVGLCLPLMFLRFIYFYKKISNSRKILHLINVIIFSVIYSFKSLSNHNFYQIVYSSYNEYINQIELFEEYGLDDQDRDFKTVEVEPSEKQKIFVVVIGESTTRHRMSLYGYTRQTNPELEKIRDELLIYNNVISAHTHSIASLKKALTYNHYENESRLKEGSLIQLMNIAGFETHWISNQKPLGLHETFVSKIAQASHFVQFLNTKYNFPPKDYDEIVLNPFKKTLERKEDLFIIVHLMGTHGEYAYRFPESFNRFKNRPSMLNDIKGLHRFNSYDNAVLYNDYIISELISEVKRHDANSYLLYFSDHGEDVYQINKSASHTESNGTFPMYDIPFILWRSQTFEEYDSLIFEPNRAYMLDDLIFSISDLSKLSFKNINYQRSIFSEDFKERNRFIYEGKIYDSIFKQ